MAKGGGEEDGEGDDNLQKRRSEIMGRLGFRVCEKEKDERSDCAVLMSRIFFSLK